jgi:hypothetical protein
MKSLFNRPASILGPFSIRGRPVLEPKSIRFQSPHQFARPGLSLSKKLRFRRNAGFLGLLEDVPMPVREILSNEAYINYAAVI